MKKLIAVDLDGVLSDTLSSFIQFHNNVYNTKLTKDHFHSDYYWEVLNETKEKTLEKFSYFTKTHYFENIQPVPGAKDVALELTKTYELIVITARQIELAKLTKEWITRHFPNTFKDVYVINHALLAKTGRMTSKGELCVNLKVDFMIEDNIYHAQDCSSDRTKVILLDQLWNQGLLDKDIQRLNSWKDIKRLLEKVDSG